MLISISTAFTSFPNTLAKSVHFYVLCNNYFLIVVAITDLRTAAVLTFGSAPHMVLPPVTPYPTHTQTHKRHSHMHRLCFCLCVTQVGSLKKSLVKGLWLSMSHTITSDALLFPISPR